MAAALREATGGEHVLLDPRKSPGTEKPHGSQSPSLNPLHRVFSHHVYCLALLGRDSSPLAGDGSWSEDASGQHWCMEDHQPPDWWGGVYQLHGEEPWAAQAYPLHPTPSQPLSWNGSRDFTPMGQVPSIPQSSVKASLFCWPTFLPLPPEFFMLPRCASSCACTIVCSWLGVSSIWVSLSSPHCLGQCAPY